MHLQPARDLGLAGPGRRAGRGLGTQAEQGQRHRLFGVTRAPGARVPDLVGDEVDGRDLRFSDRDIDLGADGNDSSNTLNGSLLFFLKPVAAESSGVACGQRVCWAGPRSP
jgi:hypothetical protein